MSRGTIFKGRSLDALAVGFGKVVRRKYQSNLNFWKATAVDDRKEYAEWNEKIETDPPKIEEQAKNKLLNIMKGQHEVQKPYLNKRTIFGRVDKNVLVINTASGFYDDLLPSDPIVRNRFSVNVNYLINMKKFSIVEEILPHQN